MGLQPGTDIGYDDDNPDRIELVLYSSGRLLAFICIYFLCKKEYCESGLNYERLSLEVMATRSNWQIANPPTLPGHSGVTHGFDFVATHGRYSLVFDIYEQAGETDVIKTYIKKLDTGATACIICHVERMTEGARRLAAEYGLKVLRPDRIESAFNARGMELQSRDRRLAAA